LCFWNSFTLPAPLLIRLEQGARRGASRPFHGHVEHETLTSARARTCHPVEQPRGCCLGHGRPRGACRCRRSGLGGGCGVRSSAAGTSQDWQGHLL
jgi:hypothetical protein